MFRNSVIEAVVLQSHRIGEYHKGVTLFSRDHGILQAIAHGAKKSKSRLRGSTETFCLSTIYLYHEPVKNTYKITDMEPKDFFENLRTDLTLYYTASLWIEVLLRSYGGGQRSEAVYELFVHCLRLLNEGPTAEQLYVSVQFLIRFLLLAGLSPELNTCDHCSRVYNQEEPIYLSLHHNSFVCRTCSENRRFVLNPGARRYLVATLEKPLNQALRIRLEASVLPQMMKVVYNLVQGLLETRLNSLEFIT